MNTSVVQAPYRELSRTPTSTAETSTGLTLSAGASGTIESFLTPSGDPGVTLVPAGLWTFYLHVYGSSATDDYNLYTQVYKRDISTAETLLFTSDTAFITDIGTTSSMFIVDGVFPTTSLLSTDRILVNVCAEKVNAGTGTIYLATEGTSHYSVVNTSFSPGNGPQGFQGWQGVQGPQGFQGPQGWQGPEASLSPGSYVMKAYKNGSPQTITNGTDTVVTFVDAFDPQNWFSSNQFQPNIAGYYSVQAAVWWDAGATTTDQNNIQLRQNGTTQVAIQQTQILNGAGYGQEIDIIVYLNGSTDYLEVTAFTGNPTSQNINGAGSGTWFTASLQTVGVGPAGPTGGTGSGFQGFQGWQGITGTGFQGFQGFTGPSGVVDSVVVIPYGATLSTDASLGNIFTVALTGNAVLENPTNSVNGKRITWRFTQDSTGGRILTLDTDFRTGSDITSIVLSSGASATDYMGAMYNTISNKWDIIAFIKGYS
jgi:hypothetical protein